MNPEIMKGEHRCEEERIIILSVSFSLCFSHFVIVLVYYHIKSFFQGKLL